MKFRNDYTFLRWLFVIAFVSCVGVIATIAVSTQGHTQPIVHDDVPYVDPGYTPVPSLSGSVPVPYYFQDDLEKKLDAHEDWISVADENGVFLRIDPSTGESDPKDIDWDRICSMSSRITLAESALFRYMAMQAGHRCVPLPTKSAESSQKTPSQANKDNSAWESLAPTDESPHNDKFISVADGDGIIFTINISNGYLNTPTPDWKRVCLMTDKSDISSTNQAGFFRAMAYLATSRTCESLEALSFNLQLDKPAKKGWGYP